MNLSIVNLPVQTVILVLILVSTAFRMKGNYKVHAGTMTFAVVFGIIFGTAGATMSFSDSSYVKTLMNPSLNLTTFISHMALGIVTFASGITLVALLLADKAIPGRSNLMAKITPILWTIVYAVGILLLVVLHVM
ncbi:MAG: hypothetical protein ABSF44_04555 [Candidatus Bathyarchaeia archaeon]